MTDQHRATPEQWAGVEWYAAPSRVPNPCANESCILELRARVEALEKAQRPVAVRFPSLRYAVETVYADPSVPVEGLVRDVSLTLEEAAEIVAAQRSEPIPADSLVKRLTDQLANGWSEDTPFDAMARAAILEVAAWLDERDISIQNDPDCLEAPFADDAIRWLREEANR